MTPESPKILVTLSSNQQQTSNLKSENSTLNLTKLSKFLFESKKSHETQSNHPVPHRSASCRRLPFSTITESSSLFNRNKDETICTIRSNLMQKEHNEKMLKLIDDNFFLYTNNNSLNKLDKDLNRQIQRSHYKTSSFHNYGRRLSR
jgi:hypothetical protein